jgi:hypothetical protein
MLDHDILQARLEESQSPANAPAAKADEYSVERAPSELPAAMRAEAARVEAAIMARFAANKAAREAAAAGRR